MKNIKQYIILILTSFSILSCEDVVNVKLDNTTPKLVIDASIKWQKGETGNVQTINLSTTTDFYSNTIPPATGATVSIINLASDIAIIYNFIETSPGTYVCTTFNPIINDDYQLTVVYAGETYKATSKFLPTPVIEFDEQIMIPGFGSEDIVQVKFYFVDEGNEDNFYLVSAKNSNIVYPEYGVITDEFFQGNLMFGVYIDDKLKPGDVIDYSVQGITEKYGNYMNKLISISGGDGGSPFATPPATLRGNIVNQNNADNYPLGYFHLSEIDTGSYTIE
jgi:Domain of unknown function (DUF4249)